MRDVHHSHFNQNGVFWGHNSGIRGISMIRYFKKKPAKEITGTKDGVN
jgi:hypothetical protein